MKTIDLLDIIEKDDSKALDAWLGRGGDANSMVHKKSLLEYSLSKNSDNCSYLLLLYGAHNAETTHPRFSRMLKEIRDSHKLMRSLPLNVLSAIDDLSYGVVGNRFMNEPRDIMSSDINGAKVLHVGLHHFEHRNSKFITETLRSVFTSEAREGKFACVVSMISKRHLLNHDRFQERITGFLIFREVPASDVGMVTMGIKMIEQETLVEIYFSDEPVLKWVEDEKQYDIHDGFFGIVNDNLKLSGKPKSIKSKHKFKEINNWSHDLNQWAQKFKARHSVYPQIVLASGDTFNRIDLVANTNSQQNITNDDGRNPNGFVKMTGFNGPGYNLQFCVDDRLELDTIKLIYDEEASGLE